MSKPIYTSSGIIRNADLPRVGIISANSEKLNQDIINELPYESGAVNLSEEEYRAELEALSDQEIEVEMERYESDGDTYLIGDWKKNSDGKYEIDRAGKEGYAATFSFYSNNISVEWSKTTRRCHHTSPCYVMAGGSGPCGDLDTDGDTVLAYDLPKEFYNKKI